MWWKLLLVAVRATLNQLSLEDGKSGSLTFESLYVISSQQITYMLSVLCCVSVKPSAWHQGEHREEKRDKQHVSLRCVI